MLKLFTVAALFAAVGLTGEVYKATTATASSASNQAVLFSSACPSTVLRASGTCANVDLNFALGQYYPSPPTAQLAVTRAQTVSSYATNVAGLLIPFAANTLRITGLGLLIEEARTNDALWARDLTNAVWVAVNTTTALNATGADGIANSATTLTATAGNATVLQSITLGSTADTSSVYLKCITCTGNIQITENNGAAWTTCASLVTTGFVRCSVTATLANPIIGLRIVNSGDSVVADFFQMEPGGFATSPIPTTTVAVTRNADSILALGGLLTIMTATQGSFVATLGAVGQTGAAILARSNTPNDKYLVNNATTTVRSLIASSGLATATFGSGTTAATFKVGHSFSAAGISNAGNNGTVATNVTAFAAAQAANQFVGSTNGSTASGFIDGYMMRLTAFNSKISDSTLKSLTQ